MSQEVLDIKIIKVHRLPDGNNRTRAFVDLGINDALLIKGIRVVDGKEGLFVSMPSELDKKSERWYERVRCLNKEVKEMIERKVLDAYQEQETTF